MTPPPPPLLCADDTYISWYLCSTVFFFPGVLHFISQVGHGGRVLVLVLQGTMPHQAYSSEESLSVLSEADLIGLLGNDELTLPSRGS